MCVAFHTYISLGDMFLPKEEIDKFGAIAGIASSFCIFGPALWCDATEGAGKSSRIHCRELRKGITERSISRMWRAAKALDREGGAATTRTTYRRKLQDRMNNAA
jgi:hypothetical protein